MVLYTFVADFQKKGLSFSWEDLTPPYIDYGVVIILLSFLCNYDN